MNWPLNYSVNVDDSIEAGHAVVREALAINAEGQSTFRIGLNCNNIWYDLTHYSRKLRTGKRLEIDGQGETVAEKYKDFADVVRYFMMYDIRPIKPKRPERPEPEYYKLIYGKQKRAVPWNDPFHV